MIKYLRLFFLVILGTMLLAARGMAQQEDNITKATSAFAGCFVYAKTECHKAEFGQ